MEELRKRISEMIIKLESFCGYLVFSPDDTISLYGEGLKLELASLIVSLAGIYERPEFEDFKEDKLYWLGQYGRIKEALSSGDVFFMIDVLKHETQENLRSFLKITEV